MLYYFFLIMDLIGMIVMVGAHYGVMPFRLVLAFFMYFIGKGIMFKGDFLSTIDFFIGIYFIFLLFNSPFFLTWVILAYGIYKTLVSFG